ncbi:MAG: putative endonuclease [Bacillota bacterium]|jgi:putative endonuclease|nr:putative endonuclease [Bacillota bacterium]MDK2960753.1 putative endonuclease [Bacillota bacterium]
MNHKVLGAEGEKMAVAYLATRGYRIRERNFRCRLGEIDVIAEEGGTLVFIEVKTRRSRRFGLPQEAVTPAKQARLRRLAEYYFLTHGGADRPCRFDVLGITIGPDGKARMDLIRGAF